MRKGLIHRFHGCAKEKKKRLIWCSRTSPYGCAAALVHGVHLGHVSDEMLAIGLRCLAGRVCLVPCTSTYIY